MYLFIAHCALSKSKKSLETAFNLLEFFDFGCNQSKNEQQPRVHFHDSKPNRHNIQISVLNLKSLKFLIVAVTVGFHSAFPEGVHPNRDLGKSSRKLNDDCQCANIFVSRAVRV